MLLAFRSQASMGFSFLHRASHREGGIMISGLQGQTGWLPALPLTR